jgi:plasmid stabilization system protein ParE
MAEIRWTEEAANWLEDIFEYIARDNPTAAANVVNGIYEKVQLLRDFPEIGHKYRSELEGEIKGHSLRTLQDCLVGRPHPWPAAVMKTAVAWAGGPARHEQEPSSQTGRVRRLSRGLASGMSGINEES